MMNTQRIWRPARFAPLSTIFLLAGIVTSGSFNGPRIAQAQVRPEVGGTVSLMTGLGGDAFSGFGEAIGLGAEVGADMDSGWRMSAGGAWSEHDGRTGFRVPGDLWRLTARIRRSFPVPGARLRPFVGLRGGIAAVDYDYSVLAVAELSLAPGSQINESDGGALVGPELGVRTFLGDRWAGELRGAYEFVDVDPVIVGADEEPGWSRSMVVSAALLFRP